VKKQYRTLGTGNEEKKRQMTGYRRRTSVERERERKVKKNSVSNFPDKKSIPGSGIFPVEKKWYRDPDRD